MAPGPAVNYLAHGIRFLDEPYFLAGTAVPDWLNVVNRKAKARAKHAAAYESHEDARVAALAAGIIQHHGDDRWFHQTRAFNELCLQLTVAFRERLAADPGFRPSFLGHVVVELLLDAELHHRSPGALDRYYDALDEVDPRLVKETVAALATDHVDALEILIPRFQNERFLYDYADDERLLWRLNHVLDRVKLERLPLEVLDLFPPAREAVAIHFTELLDAPPGDRRF